MKHILSIIALLALPLQSIALDDIPPLVAPPQVHGNQAGWTIVDLSKEYVNAKYRQLPRVTNLLTKAEAEALELELLFTHRDDPLQTIITEHGGKKFASLYFNAVQLDGVGLAIEEGNPAKNNWRSAGFEVFQVIAFDTGTLKGNFYFIRCLNEYQRAGDFAYLRLRLIDNRPRPTPALKLGVIERSKL